MALRCDCEHKACNVWNVPGQVETVAGCDHGAGACKRDAKHRVEAYGLKEKLCGVCLGVLLAFADPGDVEIDEGVAK